MKIAWANFVITKMSFKCRSKSVKGFGDGRRSAALRRLGFEFDTESAHDSAIAGKACYEILSHFGTAGTFDRSIISRRQLAGVARTNWDGDCHGEEPAAAVEHDRKCPVADRVAGTRQLDANCLEGPSFYHASN
jgi:hypothetical protein